jgi:hypothetical protein
MGVGQLLTLTFGFALMISCVAFTVPKEDGSLIGQMYQQFGPLHLAQI